MPSSPMHYPLSLHDALPISPRSATIPNGSRDSLLPISCAWPPSSPSRRCWSAKTSTNASRKKNPSPCTSCSIRWRRATTLSRCRSEEHTSELQSHSDLVCRLHRCTILFPYTTLFRSHRDPPQYRMVREIHCCRFRAPGRQVHRLADAGARRLPQTLQGRKTHLHARAALSAGAGLRLFRVADRKSTRLNSSHTVISYAVFTDALSSFPTRRSSDLTEIRHNTEWFARFTAADFVRLAAKFTVSQMLEREDFHKRFKEEKPISMHELLYPLAQGYDSFALQIGRAHV